MRIEALPATRTVARPTLSGRQLAKLRSLLADALAERRCSLEQHHAMLASLPADLSGERDLAAAALHATHADLDQIEDALDRVDAGSYGACEACGKAIP